MSHPSACLLVQPSVLTATLATQPSWDAYRRTGGGGQRSRRHRSSSFWKRKAARNPFFTPRTGGTSVGAAGANRRREPCCSSRTTAEAMAGTRQSRAEGRQPDRCSHNTGPQEFSGTGRAENEATPTRAGRWRDCVYCACASVSFPPVM